MKRYIEEYGIVILVVAITLCFLLFGKTTYSKDIQDALSNNVATLRNETEYIVNNEFERTVLISGKKSQQVGSGGIKWGEACIGERFNVNEIYTPWDTWNIWTFEIYSPVDAEGIIDINSLRNDGITRNDNDDISKRISQTTHGEKYKIKANQWTTIRCWYFNGSNEYNPAHVPLRDSSVFGIIFDEKYGNQIIKFRNIKVQTTKVNPYYYS